MGIDARMLVVVNGEENWLDEKAVANLAYLLGSTIGSDNFFTYGAHKWKDGRIQRALTVVKPWAKDGYYEEYKGQVIYTQDGDPVIAEPGQQFIEVNFWTRYYGPGYERGDWPTIKATAEFLEYKLGNPAQIFYGGDSSGVYLEPFGEIERQTIHRHYMENGHRPYVGGFNRGIVAFPDCPLCEVPMSSFGGGGDIEFLRCQGCGMIAHQKRNTGRAWIVEDHKLGSQPNYDEFPPLPRINYREQGIKG